MISRLLKLSGDIAALHLAVLCAFLLRFGGGLPEFNFSSYLRVAPWITLVLLVLGNVYDLYAKERRTYSEEISSIVVVVSLVTVAAAGLSFAVRGFSMPRSVLALAWPLQFGLSLAWRVVVYRFMARFGAKRRVLILDGLPSIDRVEAVLNDSAGLGPALVHAFAPGSEGELFSLVGLHRPSVIVIGPSLEDSLKRVALEQSLATGVEIYLVPELYDVLLHGSRRVAFGDLPVLAVDWPAEQPFRQAMKRGLDLVSAMAGLMVSLPVQLLIALVIAVTNGRPVLFKQVRSGVGGRPFTLLKFRTMRMDAEATTGPVLSAGASDPRVSAVGRFLRRTRLDELPQLWNVLAGDMSIVGPRPERPFFVDKFKESVRGYEYRLRLKPGLTGLAQVEGRYSTSVDDKLRFDLLYARSSSLWMDLAIVLKTARTILLGSKAS